jgi:hypothetical protein
MDALKRVTPQTECIIFETMVFGPGTPAAPGLNLAYDQMERLLDTTRAVELGKQAGVRHTTARLPKDRYQFFLTNIDIEGTLFHHSFGASHPQYQPLDTDGNQQHLFPRNFPNEQARVAQDTRFTLLPYETDKLFDRTRARTRKQILKIVQTLMAVRARDPVELPDPNAAL